MSLQVALAGLSLAGHECENKYVILQSAVFKSLSLDVPVELDIKAILKSGF